MASRETAKTRSIDGVCEHYFEAFFATPRQGCLDLF
jgi:hypothetical protein